MNSKDPKLTAFNEELKELCDRYLYDLTAQVSYKPNGIIAEVVVLNKLPPPKEEKVEAEIKETTDAS